jgi:Flp pilus assembly protein TadD
MFGHPPSFERQDFLSINDIGIRIELTINQGTSSKEGSLEKDKLEVLSHRKNDNEDENLHTSRKTADRKGDDISIISPNQAVFEDSMRYGKTYVGQAPARKTIEKDKAPLSVQSQEVAKPQVVRAEPEPEKAVSERAKQKPSEFSPKSVSISKGVAYLQGNSVRFTGGVRLRPGDQIKIGEREFALRVGKTKKTWMLLAAVVVLLVAWTYVSPIFKSHDNAVLVGIVADESTGEIIPGVSIHLKELDRTVQSNELGFFMFPSLPAGSYILRFTSNDHQPLSDKFEIKKDQPLTLRVNLTPWVPEELVLASDLETPAPEKSAGKKRSSDQGTTGSTFGAVKIKSNVSQPTILIDNRLAGMGNDTYRDIEPGKHVVAVTKEGYYDWAKEINVKSGRTLTLEVTLSEDKTSNPDVQTWKDFVALGNTQLNDNDLPSALNSYNQALNTKPDSPDALLGRGYTYLRMGDRTKARSDFERAAGLFQNGHDYRNAALSWGNLIALDDQKPEFYLAQGICYLKLGDNQNSISDLKRAVKLDPNSFSGHLNLGEAYYRAGDYKNSIDSYKRAQKINSEDQQVYIGLTKAYYAKGDKSKAKKSYKEFEKLSTYLYREKLKEDSEWRAVLEGMDIES